MKNTKINNDEDKLCLKMKKNLKNYLDNYDIKDENILRKYKHSIRIMNYSIEIAKSLEGNLIYYIISKNNNMC